MIGFGVSFTHEIGEQTKSLSEVFEKSKQESMLFQIFQRTLLYSIVFTIAVIKSTAWLIPAVAVKIVSLFILFAGPPIHSPLKPLEAQVKSQS